MTTLDLISTRTYGSGGPTVVVLHGGPGAPGSARGLAQALSPAFSVIEPLQRRSGQVLLTVEQHVDDLSAVAPPRAAIVGWSWGAMLGLSYAARYPERVAALALVGCGTYDERARELYKQAVARCLGERGIVEADRLERQLAQTRVPAVQDELLGRIGALHMQAEMYDAAPEAELDFSDLPADAAGHSETWEDVLRLQRESIEPQRFSAISARVIMLHGQADPHPGPATRDTLQSFVPQLEYVEFARCGHEPWRERHARARFLTQLSEWLLRE